MCYMMFNVFLSMISVSANDAQSTRLIQSVLAYWRDVVWEQSKQEEPGQE